MSETIIKLVPVIPASGPKAFWIRNLLDEMEARYEVDPQGIFSIEESMVTDVLVSIQQTIEATFPPVTIFAIPDGHPYFSILLQQRGVVPKDPPNEGTGIMSPEEESQFQAEVAESDWLTESVPEATIDAVDEELGIGSEPVLETEQVTFPAVKSEVTMYLMNSENVLKLGFTPKPNTEDQVTLYVIFKGGATYRYSPVEAVRGDDLLEQAKQKLQGIQEASVGSAFHHLIKVPADEGKIKCQRLDGDTWVAVPTKAERTKALKEKAKDVEA